MTPEMLLGPLAALALSLLFNGLFYAGRILSRNTVPREDYDKVLEINASYAKGYASMTESMNGIIKTVDRIAPPASGK